MVDTRGYRPELVTSAVERIWRSSMSYEAGGLCLGRLRAELLRLASDLARAGEQPLATRARTIFDRVDLIHDAVVAAEAHGPDAAQRTSVVESLRELRTYLTT